MSRFSAVSPLFTVALCALLLAAASLGGCRSTGSGEPLPWGPPFDDIVVPPNYQPYDNPPFLRTDSADGRRLFGRYSYRSTGEGLDNASRVAEFLRDSMANDGWELMVEEIEERRGNLMMRFRKGDDQALLKLYPDRRVRGSARYSVLEVVLNPQFE
jgi:hypothetical protein